MPTILRCLQCGAEPCTCQPQPSMGRQLRDAIAMQVDYDTFAGFCGDHQPVVIEQKWRAYQKAWPAISYVLAQMIDHLVAPFRLYPPATDSPDGRVDGYPELHQQLVEDGYRTEAPDAQAHMIDADVVARVACECCGRDGMYYHPYFRPEPRSYRAFARCPACGFEQEF